MAAMDLMVGNEVIGMMIGIKRKYTAQKVISVALDGTAYIQNTGRPVTRYEIHCYCGTAEDRDKLDDASNFGNVVTVITRDGVEVTGYIEDSSLEWKEWVDRHGVAKFTLIQRYGV